MTEQGNTALYCNNVPDIIVPGNTYATQPEYTVVSESIEQPLRETTYPVPSKVTLCDSRRPNLEIQKPTRMSDAQRQVPGLQHPSTTTNFESPPGVTQYSEGPTAVQALPGDPQNPPNVVPGPTYIPNQSQWSVSFGSFTAFDPKKFINDEVRTLGAIQIFIGLIHIFIGVNPVLYDFYSVLGTSGYLFWGGITFIVSGSLSICAEKDHSSCVVNGSIAVNIISALFSLVGIFILIADLSVYPILIKRYKMAISGGLLPFVLLEFILTCVVSHFGCQAVCYKHFQDTPMFTTMFGVNTTNTTFGPINTATGPVSTATTPVNTATGTVGTIVHPVDPASGTVTTVVVPANTTPGPVHTATSLANITTIPAYAVYPSHAAPQPSYQKVANVAQR
ncbi:membrane-spanning 4-domains subfamily A member 18 [Ochotona curzoniae]|uniref:membrane-spanning 4-domains subfamily A member 18 n=1 Tax=Ochotona curzoniae TaxID=130825 RepID=UPI001B34677A|nr:membrane-spanning 4-domains subfamily A member 18 [Ochotona curzoniae]